MHPYTDEYHFATMFFAVNKDRIQKDLQIKYLNEDATIKTIAKILEQNNLFKQSEKQSDLLHDPKFYNKILTPLYNEKNLDMTPEEYIDYLTKRLNKHTYIE